MRESPRNLESKTTLSLLKWICRVAVKVFTTMKLVMVPPRQISAVVAAVKRQQAHSSLHRRVPHLRNVVAFCEMFAQGEGTKMWIVFITFSLANVVAIVLRGNFHPLDGVIKQGQGPNDLRASICEQLRRKEPEDGHLSQHEEGAWSSSDDGFERKCVFQPTSDVKT